MHRGKKSELSDLFLKNMTDDTGNGLKKRNEKVLREKEEAKKEELLIEKSNDIIRIFNLTI